MISCQHCQTHNGLDAKFCKNCGLALPDDQLQLAVQKHEQMVSEGYALFNGGRTPEAMTIALAAVQEIPDSANAQSLLGMCYERSGQLTEALECFERVLNQNPDSALDRIKVTQLRNALSNHIRSDRRTNHRLALMAVVAIVAFSGVAGVLVASASTRKAVAQNAAVAQPNPVDQARGFVSGAPSNPMVVQTQSVASGNQADGQNLLPVGDQPAPKQGNGALPRADSRAASNDAAEADNGPTIPAVSPTINLGTARVDVPKENPGGDPSPKVETNPTPPAPQQAQAVKATPAVDDPGIIQIQISKGSPSRTVGAGESSSPNQLQALMRAARDQYLVGKYDSAAKTYEEALRAGGNQGTISQRLGMCYEKTGRTDLAVSSYTRAASAFEGEINSGQGDPKRLKTALDSCKQALKLLKG